MKATWIPALALAAAAAFADEPATQDPNPAGEAVPATAAPVQTTAAGQVNLSAKGVDVRDVLHDLFTQARRNYVLDLKDRTPLYLSLTDIEFEEALSIVCQASGLEYRLNSGIFYIAKARPKPATPTAATTTRPATPTASPTTAPVTPVTPAPRGRLPESVLNRRVTTRFDKTEFSAILKDLERQTNLRIELDPQVPKRLLDAYLIDTSLKYALDQLTQALGLTYGFTENQSIRITPKPSPNRVVALGEDPKP